MYVVKRRAVLLLFIGCALRITACSINRRLILIYGGGGYPTAKAGYMGYVSGGGGFDLSLNMVQVSHTMPIIQGFIVNTLSNNQ